VIEDRAKLLLLLLKGPGGPFEGILQKGKEKVKEGAGSGDEKKPLDRLDLGVMVGKEL
jgi:hypothetical protein